MINLTCYFRIRALILLNFDRDPFEFSHICLWQKIDTAAAAILSFIFRENFLRHEAYNSWIYCTLRIDENRENRAWSGNWEFQLKPGKIFALFRLNFPLIQTGFVPNSWLMAFWVFRFKAICMGWRKANLFLILIIKYVRFEMYNPWGKLRLWIRSWKAWWFHGDLVFAFWWRCKQSVKKWKWK